ncbi:unannotated protein [freshwater metagenome]|uniref:Unannotated protein n=1 Tax=freshwater metagenome TaxID=449393 RepID=A0A6J7TK06_9ZZZZ
MESITDSTATISPFSVTSAAKLAANNPAPAYRSSALSPGFKFANLRTVSTNTIGASLCTCQNEPAWIRQLRSPTVSSSQGPPRWSTTTCCPVELCAVLISPRPRCFFSCAKATDPSTAIRQSSISTTVCDRVIFIPIETSPIRAYRLRVRQRNPVSEGDSEITSKSASGLPLTCVIPPKCESCSRTTSLFSSR